MKTIIKNYKILTITLEEPAKSWFSDFAYGCTIDDYIELNYNEIIPLKLWGCFTRYLKTYLQSDYDEDVLNIEVNGDKTDLEKQIQDLIDVDVNNIMGVILK